MRAWATGRHCAENTRPESTRAWPVAPWSTRSRSGEPALKKGPSVCSGVRRPGTHLVAGDELAVGADVEAPAGGVGDDLAPPPPQPPARTTIAAAAIPA